MHGSWLPDTVPSTIREEHYQAAKKTETHPDDGQWPAYPSGKSHDEVRSDQMTGVKVEKTKRGGKA